MKFAHFLLKKSHLFIFNWNNDVFQIESGIINTKGRYVVMKRESALENKFQKIEQELGGQATFYAEDVHAVFPDIEEV